MSKTINETLYNRLDAQQREAKLLKLDKVASNLNDQLIKNAKLVRKDLDNYTYNSKEVDDDVQKAIWDAVIRVADYLGYSVDALKVQGTVDRLAEELFQDICSYAGANHGVGIYEEAVPGEITDKVIINVSEEE